MQLPRWRPSPVPLRRRRRPGVLLSLVPLGLVSLGLVPLSPVLLGLVPLSPVLLSLVPPHPPPRRRSARRPPRMP
ncbi:hypothetical protein [Pseudonocardia pini]|uniref:hypothetical protein n=1 Tax=Pseudonocardia pini TaxID=2758030 RepID=UPI0015F066E0|nr:hypothetical protein [Pseudonocardia pini]